MTPNLTDEQRQRLEAWVADLESGQHQQGRSALKRIDPETGETSYCCLGRACEISGLGEWGEPNDGDGIAEYRVEGCFDSTVIILPRPVADYYGIGRSGPLPRPIPDERARITTGGPLLEHNTLWHLNDYSGYDFPQIARVIREQFLGETAPR